MKVLRKFCMKITLIYALLLIMTSVSSAQGVPPVQNFTAENLQNQVRISWTIGQSSYTCLGVELQHSLDSVFAGYSVLSTYGSCGNPGSSENYEYFHTGPDFTKKNFYRLHLPPSNYGPIASVDFSTGKDGYKLYPNPIQSESTLEIVNEDNTRFILEIADPLGILLYRFENINTSKTLLYSSYFSRRGFYFFRMYSIDGSRLIKGKFAVIKN